ncbi:MAG: hypothetical protein Q8S24_10830 [Eubacteriales bacterium]|nr:hypothetical protein [Eubacteriales bacterium]
MTEISTIEILQQWAEIVIQRWISKISRLNIIDTGELLRSFTSQVHIDASGDASKIVFAFLYYGIFPDMGVGRGVPIEKVSQSNRIAKPWYSRQFYNEVKKLGYIMAERYGEKAMEAISLIENKEFVNRVSTN